MPTAQRDALSPARNLVLVGPMGAGKTAAGAAVAELLERPFHDVDAAVVAERGPIAAVFEEQGEAAFRRAEEEVALRLLDGPPSVIAFGGGTVLSDAVRRAIGPDFVVWVDVSADAVSRRLTGEDRPLLRHGLDDWRRIHTARRAVYDAVSDIRIDSSRRAVDEVARAIVDELPVAMRPDRAGGSGSGTGRGERGAPARAVEGEEPPSPLTVHELAHEWSLRNRDARQVELIGLLRRAARSTETGSDLLLADHGLNRGQFDVLAALYRRGDDVPVTQAELASRMLVSPAGIMKRLGGLVRNGLIAREADPDDARRNLLRLTDAGSALIERLLDPFFASEGAALARLDSEEQRRLIALLRSLLGS